MRLFDLDGPVFRAMGTLANLVALNLLFLLCCVPLVTIGASYTALCESTARLLDGEEGRLLRHFFGSFKKHFLRATLLWILTAAAVWFLGYYQYLVNVLPGLGKSYQIVFFLLCILFVLGQMYFFPLEAAYGKNVRWTLRQAWRVSAMALPWTLLALAVMGISVYVSFFMGTATFATAVYLWLVIVPALLTYCCQIFWQKALKKVFGEMKE